MDQAVKQKWIEALNSFKYKQYRGSLRSMVIPDCFCVLGVLCDLHAKETGTEWKGATYLNSTATLSNEVMLWAGIDTATARFDTGAGYSNLATLNDRGQFTFGQLSVIINKHF